MNNIIGNKLRGLFCSKDMELFENRADLEDKRC